MHYQNIQEIEKLALPLVDFKTGKTNWEDIRKRATEADEFLCEGKPLLYKVSSGFTRVLNKKSIYHYNYPNFSYKDIFVDNGLFSFDAYDPVKRECKGIFQGICSINETSSFPEAGWDHMSASMLMVIITQVGKTFHNLASDFNGVALVKCDYKMIKAGQMHDISFETNSSFFERSGGVWCKSSWKLYNENNGEKELFCTANTTSRGVLRNYEGLEKKQQAKESAP